MNDPVAPPSLPATPGFMTHSPRWRHYPDAPPAPPLAWLWQNFLAAGNVTLLTSQWKTGKTTLLSLLLSRMRTGGSLAGFSVAAGNALVLSEESATFWEERDSRLNLREHVCLLSQPFSEVLTHERWIALLDWIVAIHAVQNFSLVAVDSVASFLPLGVENHAGLAFQSLLALRRLTERGMAVLLNHHPRKGQTLPGQASRGTGELPAYVDIVIEMHGLASSVRRAHDMPTCDGPETVTQEVAQPGQPEAKTPKLRPPDRRRRFFSYSRHAQTPQDLVLEWTADGLDYVLWDSAEPDDFFRGWELLCAVLEAASTKLTRPQILDDWPPDYAKPVPQTLWRWLGTAVERGLLHRDGSGLKAAPFRYWLPHKMAEWLADPMGFLNNPELYEEMMEARLEEEGRK